MSTFTGYFEVLKNFKREKSTRVFHRMYNLLNFKFFCFFLRDLFSGFYKRNQKQFLTVPEGHVVELLYFQEFRW